ncbi:unnamed protein product [Chironomus riparius]|uniref:Single domain-containing protein n=1 Tax=Chironomus riparius TaxID=315576 RepID=A0A9N9RSF6_9DIPT|nr:unnamed protein product [Chironomus riparius]
MLNSKVAFLFLILNIFIVNINAATWFYENTNKTVCDVTGKCEDYCNVDGQLIKPGESFKTKDCSEIICSKDFTARGVTCGIAIEDGCKMEPDFTLEYPDCCYKICGEKVE